MNLLCRMYFVTGFLILYNHAADFQQLQIIEIERDSNESVVHLNKTLNIVLKDFIIKKNTRCFYGPERKPYTVVVNGTDRNILHIPSVKKGMSTEWRCEKLGTSQGLTEETISFKIRVKTAYRPQVSVAGQLVSFETTNQSVTDCDGIYKYECEEGDTLDLSCRNDKNEGHILLQYFDSQGIPIITTQSFKRNESILSFRMLVRDKNVNGFYVDCSYVTPINPIEQQFTYRTIFTVITKNPSARDGFIVNINGTQLTPMLGSYTADRYVYQVIGMEPLQLTCLKKNEQLQSAIHGKITNNNYNSATVIKVIKNNTITLTTLIETKNLEGAVFQCYSGSEEHKLVSKITFLKQPNQDTYLLGLSARDILYEYTTDSNGYIHYKYTVQQALNLTCVTSGDRSPQWVYKGEKTQNTYKTINGFKYINHEFHLDDEPKENITCLSKKRRTRQQNVTVILHRVLDMPSQVQAMHFTALETIGIVAGILVAIAAISMSIIYWWRKKKNSLLNKELHKEYTLNVYTYIEIEDGIMVANDLYTGNAQKNVTQNILCSSSCKEDHYTEIVDKTIHNEMNTIYNVPYEAQNINKNKHHTHSDEHYENLQMANKELQRPEYKNL